MCKDRFHNLKIVKKNIIAIIRNFWIIFILVLRKNSFAWSKLILCLLLILRLLSLFPNSSPRITLEKCSPMKIIKIISRRDPKCYPIIKAKNCCLSRLKKNRSKLIGITCSFWVLISRRLVTHTKAKMILTLFLKKIKTNKKLKTKIRNNFAI